ncbi:hypothetical protein MJG53_003739, partial [Ovis ammon polii x Ovis aries]
MAAAGARRSPGPSSGLRGRLRLGFQPPPPLLLLLLLAGAAAAASREPDSPCRLKTVTVSTLPALRESDIGWSGTRAGAGAGAAAAAAASPGSAGSAGTAAESRLLLFVRNELPGRVAVQDDLDNTELPFFTLASASTFSCLFIILSSAFRRGTELAVLMSFQLLDNLLYFLSLPLLIIKKLQMFLIEQLQVVSKGKSDVETGYSQTLSEAGEIAKDSFNPCLASLSSHLLASEEVEEFPPSLFYSFILAAASHRVSTVFQVVCLLPFVYVAIVSLPPDFRMWSWAIRSETTRKKVRYKDPLKKYQERWWNRVLPWTEGGSVHECIPTGRVALGKRHNSPESPEETGQGEESSLISVSPFGSVTSRCCVSVSVSALHDEILHTLRASSPRVCSLPTSLSLSPPSEIPPVPWASVEILSILLNTEMASCFSDGLSGTGQRSPRSKRRRFSKPPPTVSASFCTWLCQPNVAAPGALCLCHFRDSEHKMSGTAADISLVHWRQQWLENGTLYFHVSMSSSGQLAQATAPTLQEPSEIVEEQMHILHISVM